MVGGTAWVKAGFDTLCELGLTEGKTAEEIRQRGKVKG